LYLLPLDKNCPPAASFFCSTAAPAFSDGNFPHVVVHDGGCPLEATMMEAVHAASHDGNCLPVAFYDGGCPLEAFMMETVLPLHPVIESVLPCWIP
jgi:NADH:ubiquinone oxidoreductase subunit B-like Fe-S oxidoreductase